MTRKPLPKHPCPSCGRLVGSYQAATGPRRSVRHMAMGPNAVNAHKAIGASWCPGGIIHTNTDPHALHERKAIQDYEKECEREAKESPGAE